jgi:hypothetical protein
MTPVEGDDRMLFKAMSPLLGKARIMIPIMGTLVALAAMATSARADFESKVYPVKIHAIGGEQKFKIGSGLTKQSDIQ